MSSTRDTGPSFRTPTPELSIARELAGHEVLVVDADDKVHQGLVQLLATSGLHVSAVPDPVRAMELLRQKFFGVVILDLDTPAPGEGLKLVDEVHRTSPLSLVLVLSPRKSFDAAVAAFRAGAHDVIVKAPDQVDYLKERVVSAAGQVARKGRQGELNVEVKATLEEFLKRTMDAERRVVDLEDKAAGRDPHRSDIEEEVRAIVVDADERLWKSLDRQVKESNDKRFSFALAHSGGDAMDRITSSRFHVALVAENLPDLPWRMVISTMRAQSPDMTCILYSLGGRLDIVEGSRMIPIVDKFTAAQQLIDRLDEIGQAHRAKGRERRYHQAFRERHYDFLRRLAELRKKLDGSLP